VENKWDSTLSPSEAYKRYVETVQSFKNAYENASSDIVAFRTVIEEHFEELKKRLEILNPSNIEYWRTYREIEGWQNCSTYIGTKHTCEMPPAYGMVRRTDGKFYTSYRTDDPLPEWMAIILPSGDKLASSFDAFARKILDPPLNPPIASAAQEDKIYFFPFDKMFFEHYCGSWKFGIGQYSATMYNGGVYCYICSAPLCHRHHAHNGSLRYYEIVVCSNECAEMTRSIEVLPSVIVGIEHSLSNYSHECRYTDSAISHKIISYAEFRKKYYNIPTVNDRFFTNYVRGKLRFYKYSDDESEEKDTEFNYEEEVDEIWCDWAREAYRHAEQKARSFGLPQKIQTSEDAAQFVEKLRKSLDN